MITPTTKNVNAPASQLSDEELVTAILGGARDLLNNLYNRYSDRVYHKCLAMVKEQALAQDATHDVFVKVFTNLQKFEGKSDFSFWVYAITYNHCISYLRKAKRVRFSTIDEVNEPVDHAEEALSERLVKEMRISQLERLLHKLDHEEEILLIMKYQDGMSIKQIATILQIGESAVKMRLKRTRGRLGTLLNAMPHE